MRSKLQYILKAEMTELDGLNVEMGDTELITISRFREMRRECSMIEKNRSGLGQVKFEMSRVESHFRPKTSRTW